MQFIPSPERAGNNLIQDILEEARTGGGNADGERSTHPKIIW